jgi:hypothetical protein
MSTFWSFNDVREKHNFSGKYRIISYNNLPSLNEVIIIFKIKNLYNNE